MNAERLAMMPHVENLDDQKAIIKDTDSIRKIQAHYRSHFGPGFLYDFEKELEVSLASRSRSTSISADHARLIGVANNLGAQFGYDSMEGQFMMKGEYSPFDPWRQLALASYVAGLNMEAATRKQELSDQFERYSHEAAVGIWGVLFVVKKGMIVDPVKITVFDTKWYEAAKTRATERRKVLVPNHDLNKSVSELDFSFTMAETMDEHELEVHMMPRVVEALGEYLDPGLAFFTTRRAPLRIYSLPNSSIT
ncbi:MAG: hypothetical protein RLZZ455_905 [Candidatus Parcubacteria bacterium]|jgi:hypothetical protein